MKFTGSTEEHLFIQRIDSQSCDILQEPKESSLSILWFEEDHNILIIDGKEEHFDKNQIVFLTEFHKIVPKYIGSICFLRFNRPFYCVLDHDAEVSCKGLLFFGAAQLPIITIPDNELEKFTILIRMFLLEMESNDHLQMEMLQMMLKRYLILCTRLYKEQHDEVPEATGERDLIREYNFLIEQHFRTKHSVAEYAELLFKSPKTLSNIFAKIGSKTPLQYIHERIMLEAKRLLHYSDKSVKEIAFEVGYDNIQAFSRFFKKHEGISPSAFKEKIDQGKIANISGKST